MNRYITTPLYYVNATPHLGHFYTTMLADTLKRHHGQRGDAVFFLTGTDEHGQKVSDMAKKQGLDERAFVDSIATQFQSTWDACDLQYDRFYRTTEPGHVRAVQDALQTLKDKGEIVFREYEGLYDVGSERFVKESELTPDGLIAETLTKPEYRKESNYFFLMSRYRDRLIEYFENNPSSIRPDQYRGEMLSFLKNNELEDLCISRPKDRLSWGVELPFDKNYVTYVWFDALLNYLVATGWPGTEGTGPGQFNRAQWESVTHFMAKDIVKTHSIYWGAMLMALGVAPAKHLAVHGYWLMGSHKMSKTIGNVVRPLEIKEKFGIENFRFYLLREMSFGMDSNFGIESFVQSSNAYLANGIGNLVSRVVTLCTKNFKGSFPQESLLDSDRALLQKRESTLKAWDEAFTDLKFQNALKAWSELVTATDLYINDNKPWALAKDPALSDRLQVVLGVALNTIQTLGVLAYPVLPRASLEICRALGIPHDEKSGPSITQATLLRDHFALNGEVPKLFARLELPKEGAVEETKK